jgi:hypothetical protein
MREKTKLKNILQLKEGIAQYYEQLFGDQAGFRTGMQVTA